MIRKEPIYDVYVLICDICGEYSGSGFSSFIEAAEWAMMHGWGTHMDHGATHTVITHKCPKCK